MVQQYSLEDSLGHILGRTVRSLGARLHRNFANAGYDLTCEQWGLLRRLDRNNGVNQQELAVTSCKDKTSMVRLIDGLEKR
ncbi:MAG: MarR family transcriptional regulator, partial [Candidatus Omnitrophica bacterium]|nr:MarR family transcriptional regulator [Candidatus Omnitrophota bacterium]